MKGIIMAGGEGTRLRPLTCDIPKPMVPIYNKPVMEHIINLLKRHGIVDIAATLFYLPSSIMDYFGDGALFGVKLSYYIEDAPLGTGGSVLNAEEFIDDTFVVISGDALTDINISEAVEFHKRKGSKATLVLKRESNPLEYGIVITKDDGRIIKFLEKPSWGEVFSDTINTGIYILEPEVFSYYKKGENFDFSKDLFPKLLMDSIPMFGYVSDGYWCDVGDLFSYKNTHFHILDGKVEIDKGDNIGNGVNISGSAKIIEPVAIGNNCTIKDGATIGPYCVIGDNCIVDENSSIKRSILWDGVHIGKNAQLRGATVAGRVWIKSAVNLFEDSVVGKGCSIEANVTVKPKVKIWPEKLIKEGSILKSSLVWGAGYSRKIFGNRDVSGEMNIDITPEFASLIGSVFASVIAKDINPIVVTCENNPSSIVIRDSMVSGMLSTGKNAVKSISHALPITRFLVRFFNAHGGVHISLDNDYRVHIEFMNSMGGTIDRATERKIESLFSREDFERCPMSYVKSPVKIENTDMLYINYILKSMKSLDRIKRSSPHILIASYSKDILDIAAMLITLAGFKVKSFYIDKEEKPDDFLKSFSYKTSVSGAVLGAVIGGRGEDIILVDENGRQILGDRYHLLSLLMLFNSKKVKRAAIPHYATRVIETIANDYGVEIIRTKSPVSELMNEMLKIGDNSLLQYKLHFDAIASLAFILDYLHENSLKLSELAFNIPEFYSIKSEVSCDFSLRGRIIRRLIEKNNQSGMELFEGFKIETPNGWSLLIPDNEKPVFNIYTEGFSEEYAKEISNDMKDMIEELINSDDS